MTINKAFSIFLCAENQQEAVALKSALHAVDATSHLAWVNKGEELLRLLDLGERPDFVFLDAALMEENGPRFLSQIREKANHRRLPVIVYAGKKESAYVEISFEKGTDLFTHKTIFLKNDIHIVLEKLLHMYRHDWSISRREGFAVFIDIATGLDYSLGSHSSILLPSRSSM
jgi:CheY-like chemotaxis protein